jgi:hypothetical protein
MPQVAKKSAAKKAAAKKAVAKHVDPVQPGQKPKMPGMPVKAVVLYPNVAAKIFSGESKLTAEQAKKLLGWATEADGEDWGSEYHLKDAAGRKVRCHNNWVNRPIRYNQVVRYCQDILRGNWILNGETIIIGKSGRIMNGQHRLVGLILADYLQTKNPKEYPNLKSPVGIETIVVTGVEESDEVFVTIDNGLARSLADVIYLSPYFAKSSMAERKKLSSMASHAIRLLWTRTGIKFGKTSPQQTHTESVDFLDNHPTLLYCFRFVLDEEKSSKGGLSKAITLGYCSAIMYLMIVSGSEQADHEDENTKVISEAGLDKSRQELAETFIRDLAARTAKFEDVWQVIADVQTKTDDPDDFFGIGGTADERLGILAKAWQKFVAGEEMAIEDLRLTYLVNKSGKKVLAECPLFGGIDLGDDVPTSEEGEEDDTPTDMTVTKRLKTGGLYWTKNADGPGQHRQGYLQSFNGTACVFSMAGETWTVESKEVSVLKPS